jgi:ABC-2 type transport system permease protein
MTVISRFVAGRTVRSATFVALAFGVFVTSKTVGYAQLYPTVRDRLDATVLIANNIGLKVLFGTPYHLESVAGYAVWYALTMGVLLGSIWAYLMATRVFRGEETAGRWELLLAGLTTARRAAAETLAGAYSSLIWFYLIAAGTLVVVGQVHGVNVAPGPALYLALAAICGAVMFVAVGAFASQLMPTRALAAGLSTAVFGVCFLVRAAGDITTQSWLLDITPLGWIERLHPLFNPQPIWLLPIFGLTTVLIAGTIILAGRRDLGAAFIAGRDSRAPRTGMLSGPLAAAVRLTRGATLSWLGGLLAFAVFFGALTGTAAQAFSTSASAQHYVARLTGATQSAGAKTFLGIVFLLLMLLIMSYTASTVSSMREDEATGRLDQFLVHPISRQRWLWGRLGLIIVALIIGCALATTAVWLCLGANHYGLTAHDLASAGLNLLPPAALTLGVAVFALGIWPRLTAVFAYGIIAWSFLLQMISSGLNLNHWLLDTSVFYHVALAPAASPNWPANIALILISTVLVLAGALAFNRRDLASE